MVGGASAGATELKVTLADIESARRVIADVVLRTPMLPAPKLSALTGAEVYVKYENLQVTNSFKDRGALVKLASLREAERKRGVISDVGRQPCPGGRLSCRAVGNPGDNRHAGDDAIRESGRDPIIWRRSCFARRNVWRKRRRAANKFAPSATWLWFTLTMILKSLRARGRSPSKCSKTCRTLTSLVIPIGGGGLIAGNAIAARAKKPAIEIVGAEAALYPSVWNALRGENRPIGGPTLAEGIAVKNVGKLTLPIIRDLVADIILLDEAHLERAVNAYLTLQKTMAEGAGAAGLAAMLAKPERFKNKKVGLVLCGGNIDPRVLASIMVRELERDSRIVAFRLTIPDRPGVLGIIATRIGALGANILEVDHRRLFLDVPAKGAKLDVTIETRDMAHAEEIMAALAADGYGPVRLEAGAAMD